jgi:hypothetical protein
MSVNITVGGGPTVGDVDRTATGIIDGMLTGPTAPDSEGDRLGTLGWDVGTDVGANVGRGVGVVAKGEAVESEKSQ